MLLFILYYIYFYRTTTTQINDIAKTFYFEKIGMSFRKKIVFLVI